MVMHKDVGRVIQDYRPGVLDMFEQFPGSN